MTLLAAATPLAAQTSIGVPPPAPSQVAPQPFQTLPRPLATVPRTPITIGDEAPPPGANETTLILSGIQIQGEFEELRNVGAELARQVVGRTISVAALFDVARALEKAYVNAGYVLVRVVVPQQTLADHATARIDVIDGYIEQIEGLPFPERIAGIVRARLQPLVGQRHLALAQLERRILLASDAAGVSLTTALSRGHQPGAVVLSVGGTYALTTTVASVDNRNGTSLGRWQGAATVSLNGAAGFGERAYASLNTNREVDEIASSDPMLRTGVVGMSVPIGIDGLSLSAEYATSATHAHPTPFALDMRGELQRLSVRAEYAVIRARDQNLSATLAIEGLRQAAISTLFGISSLDDYLAVRSALDWSSTTTWNSSELVSVSLSTGLGGRGADDALASHIALSRSGADPHFTKLGLRLQHTQDLPGTALRVDVSASAQTSFGDPLFTSEQLTLNGPTLVGGLPSGYLSADTGAAGRIELQAPGAMSIDQPTFRLMPYLFAAGGAGRLERPTAVERSTFIAHSFGAGFRSDVRVDASVAQTIEFELARQSSDLSANEPDTRASFALTSRF